MSGSAEPFGQIVFDCAVHAMPITCKALFTESMSVEHLCCLHVDVQALSWLGGL